MSFEGHKTSYEVPNVKKHAYPQYLNSFLIYHFCKSFLIVLGRTLQNEGVLSIPCPYQVELCLAPWTTKQTGQAVVAK